MSQTSYDCPYCTARSLTLVGRDIDGVSLRCGCCGKELRLSRDLWDLFCEKPGDSLPEFLALVKAFNYFDMD